MLELLLFIGGPDGKCQKGFYSVTGAVNSLLRALSIILFTVLFSISEHKIVSHISISQNLSQQSDMPLIQALERQR